MWMTSPRSDVADRLGAPPGHDLPADKLGDDNGRSFLGEMAGDKVLGDSLDSALCLAGFNGPLGGFLTNGVDAGRKLCKRLSCPCSGV